MIKIWNKTWKNIVSIKPPCPTHSHIHPKYPLPNTPILATSEQLQFDVFFNLCEIKFLNWIWSIFYHHFWINFYWHFQYHSDTHFRIVYRFIFRLVYHILFVIASIILSIILSAQKSYSILRTILCIILYVFNVHTPYF